MCKQFGAENEGSAMAVQQAREVLPTNVKPLHYDLTLEPDFEKATYEGSVTIEYAIAHSRTTGRSNPPRKLAPDV
jgi:aminopeptidase 2